MKAEERVHHRVGTYSDLRLGYQQVAIPLAVESLFERNRIRWRSSIFSSGQPGTERSEPKENGSWGFAFARPQALMLKCNDHSECCLIGKSEIAN